MTNMTIGNNRQYCEEQLPSHNLPPLHLLGLASPPPPAEPAEPPPQKKEGSPRRIFPFERKYLLGLASPLYPSLLSRTIANGESLALASPSTYGRSIAFSVLPS